MGTLGWRMAPIFFLSVREFIGGKAVRAVFALGLIPALFALIYRINPDVDRPRRFLDDIVIQVMLPSVLPLATLILATGAFGDEIDDRTLPYLVLKPITRIRIVLDFLAERLTRLDREGTERRLSALEPRDAPALPVG